MKKALLVLFISLLYFPFSNAQSILNMTQIANVDYDENCNDIWGYVDPDDGHEYAVLGTVLATAILDLEDPANPEEVAYIEGSLSTWRDMKQWGEYIYVTTDSGADGLLIVNMSNAPDSITWEFWTPDLTVGLDTQPLEACHNIYIDEKGFAYLSGCNLSNEAVIILDIHTTPGTPVMVGASDIRYSHDNFARGDTLYSADIFGGVFSISDISDRTNPVELATQSTSFNFTHNIWPSTDGKYVFTTDERANAFVDAYDISDLENIKFLDSYRPKDTEGTGVIPHNTHYHPGGYLVTSWYTDGIIVIDANRPENLVKVANYDTNTDFTEGFHGCWGAYPFLPSGLMLASDIENGLFVFGIDFVRASYLEGKITNSVTGTPINNADVEFLATDPNGANSDMIGIYRTGLAQAGTYDVVYSKPGYFPKTINVSIASGEVTIQDVQLEPIATFSGRVISAVDGAGIPKAEVIIFNDQLGLSFSTTADNNGDFTMPSFQPNLNYDIVGGSWGYLNGTLSRNLEPSTTVTIVLEKGYQDDFILDLGWKVSSVANAGVWERGEPVGTTVGPNLSNPDFDIDGDIGALAYVTGNGGGSAGSDDVDNGETILTSPSMALTSMNSPQVSYYTWFYNALGNNAPNDSMIVSVSNGTETAVLEVIKESNSEWREQSVFNLNEFITITDNMTIEFFIADTEDGNLLEGAVDVFLVQEGEITPVSEVFQNDIQLKTFPNPFSNEVTVQFQSKENQLTRLEVYNLLGQNVLQLPIDQKAGTLQLGNQWEKGVYFIHLTADNQQTHVIKVVKQ